MPPPQALVIAISPLLDAPQTGPDELRAAASRVLAEAERLIAALDGAGR